MPASGHVPKVIIVKKSARVRPKAMVFNMSLSQDLVGPFSGNSIPEYVPVEGFMAMVAVANEIRTREGHGQGLSSLR